MISDSRDRPAAPGAATVTVPAAFLVGVGAVGVSSVLASPGLRVLVAVAVAGAGLAVARLAGRGPLSAALGAPVLRGTGTSLIVLGAYLLGLALLTAWVPGTSGPSPAMAVLLVYGVPALAVAGVATTRMRAWTAGAGVILPMLAVLLLTSAGAGAGLVSAIMLAVGLVLAAVVPRAPAVSAWGDLASAAAAMSASFAFGGGVSPFGLLGAAQLGGAAADGADGGLTGGVQALVVGGALVVAVVVLVVAVLRDDLAAGVLAGSVFAMPPVLLMWADQVLHPWTQGVVVALPVLVVLVAAVAIRSYRFRRALVSVPRAIGGREAEQDAVTAAGCAVVVAAGAVAFLVLAMPAFEWDLRVQGVVALVVLVGTAALAYWLPDPPGAAAAVVALLGLALAAPWARLLTGGSPDLTSLEWSIVGPLDLAAAGTLAVLLVRRHPRVGVYAAAAYVLAGSAAAFLALLLYNPHEQGDWAPVLIVALPLVLLAVPAAVAAFGGRAAVGQAVGAVVLAAGGFLTMKVTAFESGAGNAIRLVLAPLTPTDRMSASAGLRGFPDPALAAGAVLVLVALALGASLARRPSASLAAAVALLLLAAVQVSLLTALSGSPAGAETLGWILGACALVAGLVAVGVALGAARRERAGGPSSS